MDEMESLNKELERQLEELSKTGAGSDDARRIVDDYIQLAKIALERDKLNIESRKNEMSDKLERDKLESQIKADEEKLKEEHKRGVRDFWCSLFGHVISAGGIGVTVWSVMTNNKHDWRRLIKVLKFEETGSIGSLGGKTVIGSFGRRR